MATPDEIDILQEDGGTVSEYIKSPRQLKMWKDYTNPKSPTFGNAYQSALGAGYTPLSSAVITQTAWFKNRILKLGLLSKAEKVLENTLIMDTTDENGFPKADLIRVQADTAKFVAKTLGKDEGYTERNEMTGKDGGAIVFMPAELMEKYNLETKEEEDITTN